MSVPPHQQHSLLGSERSIRKIKRDIYKPVRKTHICGYLAVQIQVWFWFSVFKLRF